MSDQNHWYPFVKEQKKVKTLKDHACTFSGCKIYKGHLVESASVNTRDEVKKTKTRLYMCGKCDECKHLLEVRKQG